MAYFVVHGLKKGPHAIVSGDFILSGTMKLDGPTPETSSSSQPAPTIPKFREIKWVLPPRTSEFYDRIKAFAEGAGYETVENDDLTYPGPRI